MPKSAKDFLTVLLTKAGVKMDDEAITTALASAELATIQIPDALITPIDNGLLSVQAAKNNHPEIKGHYTAQALDSLDKELERAMDDYKLPDEIKTELKGEKSSYKRATLLAAKIKNLEEQKASSGKGEKDVLQQEINKLNGELRDIKAKEQTIHEDYKKQLLDVKMGHSLGQLLGAYKTKFDELPANVKSSTLQAIINNSLTSDNAEFTVDEAGQLLLRKKGGDNFFGDDHSILTPKTYLDKILARDKILITTDQSQNNGGGANSHNRNNGQTFQRQNQNQGNSGNNGNGNGKAASNTAMQSLVEEALQGFSGNGQ
jgi:hypothetical protein